MPATAKDASPVDRAAAELEAQIAALQHQVRQLEQPRVAAKPKPPTLWEKFVQVLQPPKRTPALPPRRDLFDVSPNPVKELAGESAAVAGREPDLFSPTRGRDQQEKLAHYLQAGSLGAQKPLRHVQRKHRQQFAVWLSLAIVVVVVLWIVVR
jgi:hypothetical protein